MSRVRVIVLRYTWVCLRESRIDGWERGDKRGMEGERKKRYAYAQTGRNVERGEMLQNASS